MWKPLTLVVVGAVMGIGIVKAAPQKTPSSELQWGMDPALDAAGYKMPILLFLTQRKCDQCGNHLPKQCVIYGHAKSDVTGMAVATVLDHTSQPKWVVVDGHRVPDAQWVNDDKTPAVKAIFARTHWPSDWNLEDWLAQQRKAESERLKNLDKTAALPSK